MNTRQSSHNQQSIHQQPIQTTNNQRQIAIKNQQSTTTHNQQSRNRTQQHTTNNLSNELNRSTSNEKQSNHQTTNIHYYCFCHCRSHCNLHFLLDVTVVVMSYCTAMHSCSHCSQLLSGHAMMSLFILDVTVYSYCQAMQ